MMEISKWQLAKQVAAEVRDQNVSDDEFRELVRERWRLLEEENRKFEQAAKESGQRERRC